MQPTFITIPEKNLVGKKIITSLSYDKTAELWKSFMTELKGAGNHPAELFSLQVYALDYFINFDPKREFQKWALAERALLNQIPDSFNTFHLKSGLYAVFRYKGLAKNKKIFEYIFREWLPTAAFGLDDRPHFEILGEKYSNESDLSEEDIYIPVKPKT